VIYQLVSDIFDTLVCDGFTILPLSLPDEPATRARQKVLQSNALRIFPSGRRLARPAGGAKAWEEEGSEFDALDHRLDSAKRRRADC
jgi:hypothetical protein